MVPSRVRTATRRSRAPLVALGLAMAIAACDEPQPRGRVEGVVRTGVSCGDASGQVCVPRAVSGEVQVVGDGEVRASARTEPSGYYELTVGAGEYTVVVDVGGPDPVCPPRPVRVASAGTVTVDIDCV